MKIPEAETENYIITENQNKNRKFQKYALKTQKRRKNNN